MAVIGSSKLRIVFLCIYLLFFSGYLYSIDATQISVQVNQNEIYENQPIPGSILITHPKKDVVDVKSFVLEKTPLKVNFIKDVDVTNSDLVTTIYKFEMPAKPAGLHLIPEVTVKVGNKTYTSVSTGFQVKSGAGNPVVPSTSGNTPIQKFESAPRAVSLKLESFYDGPELMYPGTRGWLGYRYYFNDNITISQEILPLFDANGFKKIGSKVIQDKEVQEWSVREIRQEIEALKPGTFTFPVSQIEGYPYKIDAYGKKQISNKKITAEAPSITLKVLPFPEKSVPKSFTGAIGQYTLNVTMTTAKEMRVGDKITLVLTFTGTGQYSTIHPPELCCIPGFSGLFHTSDVPPLGKDIQGGKSFTIDLRPLSASISAIPSIEFTYFDPVAKKYVTIMSDPIPITVKPLPKERNIPSDTINKGRESGLKPEKTEVAPIEIGENYSLIGEDVHNLPFGSWWSLIIVPIGLGILALQRNMKMMIEKTGQEIPKETPERLFSLAMAGKEFDSEFFFILNRAFLLLLKERGVIDNIEITPHALPEKPPAGEVRKFLLDLEERRFSKSGAPFTDEDKQNAKALFNRMVNIL